MQEKIFHTVVIDNNSIWGKAIRLEFRGRNISVCYDVPTSPGVTGNSAGVMTGCGFAVSDMLDHIAYLSEYAKLMSMGFEEAVTYVTDRAIGEVHTS